ncbi:MAG: hypothetical protein ACD_39C00407G0003, partial [uncultured bacterium]
MTPNDEPSHNKLEILVVEDSLTQAQKLERLLESRQFLVRLAEDGRRALELIG